MKTLFGPAVAITCALAGPALALSPSEVFEKVSPSVWAVHGLDAQDRPFSYGSAVVIGQARLVTNCHVLAKAKSIRLRRDNVLYEAKLEHADAERDLCVLSVANFFAPAVSVIGLEKLKIGQRVYAIGNPETLALTLSEGLISGLRSEDRRLPPLQTSAPISSGSSGGGLFDDQGRLIGITTLTVMGRSRSAQNLNFAVPAEWIAEVPERAREQLAKLRGSTTTASAAAPAAIAAAAPMPAVGTTWTYNFSDQIYRHERSFTVKVTQVSGWTVSESFSPEGGDASQSTFEARDLRFAARPFPGTPLIELAPYFVSELAKPGSFLAIPAKYPGGAAVEWKVSRAERTDEEISVTAGTFKTIRVRVTGAAPPGTSMPGTGYATRFVYTAWYAPEVKRYVKLRHETWSRWTTKVGDETVQLVEYRPEATADSTPKAEEKNARATDGLPMIGARWKYSFRDQHLKSPERFFTVRVTGVDGWNVSESFFGPAGPPVATVLNAKDLRFGAPNRLSGYSVLELAPYLYSSESGKSMMQSPTGYPSPKAWKIGFPKVSEDEGAQVPAGTFSTLRVEVTGTIEPFGRGTNEMSQAARFQYTAWYAPKVKRYVMARHQTWSAAGAKIGDEIIKLVEYGAD